MTTSGGRVATTFVGGARASTRFTTLGGRRPTSVVVGTTRI